MKHRIASTKIDPELYKRLYYEARMSNKEIAEYLGCAVSSLGSIRQRYGMKPRDKRWSMGAPWKGKSRAEETNQKISKTLTGKLVGDKNPFWKGGHYLNYAGYRRVRVSVNMYELEHRIVMEKHLGRKLLKKEVVHHIDGNKLNNDISNLLLTDHKTHGHIHIPKGSLVGSNSSRNK